MLRLNQPLETNWGIPKAAEGEVRFPSENHIRTKGQQYDYYKTLKAHMLPDVGECLKSQLKQED